MFSHAFLVESPKLTLSSTLYTFDVLKPLLVCWIHLLWKGNVSNIKLRRKLSFQLSITSSLRFMTDSLCGLKVFLINLKYVSVVFCRYSETYQNPVRTFSFETAKLMLILTVPETPRLYLITYTNLSCLSCDKIKILPEVWTGLFASMFR